MANAWLPQSHPLFSLWLPLLDREQVVRISNQVCQRLYAQKQCVLLPIDQVCSAFMLLYAFSSGNDIMK